MNAAHPYRVQLSRKKGWRMPANTVKVCRPGKFGNPYWVGADLGGGPMTATDAVELFKIDLRNHGAIMGWDKKPTTIAAIRQELKGKNLACWCKPGVPCHADVLLEWANKYPSI